jgi:hypothetical protein
VLLTQLMQANPKLAFCIILAGSLGSGSKVKLKQQPLSPMRSLGDYW